MAKNTEADDAKKERETVEGIAEHIEKLAMSIQTLVTGRLNRKALVTLLAYSTGESRHIVDKVLTALENLSVDFLNK